MPSINYSNNSRSRSMSLRWAHLKRTLVLFHTSLSPPKAHLYRGSTSLPRQEHKPGSETPTGVKFLPLSRHKSRASARLVPARVINWLSDCTCQKPKSHCIWNLTCWACWVPKLCAQTSISYQNENSLTSHACFSRCDLRHSLFCFDAKKSQCVKECVFHKSTFEYIYHSCLQIAIS